MHHQAVVSFFKCFYSVSQDVAGQGKHLQGKSAETYSEPLRLCETSFYNL